MSSHSLRALRVGIDASNIRRGGGLTHLIQLLHAADPAAAGIGEICVWAPADTLEKLPDRSWLHKHDVAVQQGRLAQQQAWLHFGLRAELKHTQCDVLFAPGGLLPHSSALPMVTMSRNMLPFEPVEAARFGVFTPMWIKMQLLRRGQSRSMKRADGLIFLSEYARRRVLATIGPRAGQTRVIPHGLAERFFFPPRPVVRSELLGEDRPFRLLYVSTVDMYKHQWEVVRAVGALREAAVPVRLDLVGSSVPTAMAKLQAAMAEVDPAGSFITYHDSLPFETLHKAYEEADAFVFASSCENLPNILLEAMAAGLPIASSQMGPMPEVLGDAGVYFDPLDSRSIAAAIRQLVDDPMLRERLGREAFQRAQAYSWTRCASDTFQLISDVARHHARRAA